MTLGLYESMGDYRKAWEYVPNLRKTTADKVLEAAEKYLTEKNCTLVSYRPADR